MRLFPGEYEDEMPMYEYWHAWISRNGKIRFILCNCHGGSRDAACVLCYKCQEEKNDNLLAKPRIAVNAVHMADFHSIEKTNERGTVWHELVQCGGTDALGRNLCVYCDNGIPAVEGKKGFLNLGHGYWKNFTKVIAEVRKTCASCAGSLHVLRWKCAECGEVLLDLDKTTASPEQRQKMDTEEVVCPVCVHKGPAAKDVGCFHHDAETNKYTPGCDNPVPADIFGVDLTLHIDGEGANSTLVCTNIKVVTAAEAAKTAELVAEPYDFEEFLGSMSLEEQATILGLDKIPKALMTGEMDGNVKPPSAKATDGKTTTVDYD